MKILVVDLGSQWTHRIYRTLRYLDVDTRIIPCTTPLGKIEADGLVLSGGAIRIGLGEISETGEAGRYLDEFTGPIMGICAGQQFMGLHFGGKARPSEKPEYGKVELIVDEKNDLFEGLPDRFTVWASHNDEVIDIPDFQILAHSKDCANHAMKHRSRPLYGCLFHPEVEHTEYGSQIYSNFIKTCKR